MDNIITLPIPNLTQPFRLIKIPGGTFTMGDNNGEYDREKPEHLVTVSDFYMSEFQVTQEMYEAIITSGNPSYFKGKRKPVEKVSWEDAVAFCNKLNENNNYKLFCDKDYNLLDSNGKPTKDITQVKGYRLPTEAEWEYAARGGIVGTRHGVSLQFAGSNDPNLVAWYDGNANDETKEVGLKFPNACGLYDMSGNVYEWCWDWFNDKYYEKCKAQGTVVNPLGNESGSYRGLRGGSWYDNARNCRSAYRLDYAPSYRRYYYGFRLVRAF